MQAQAGGRDIFTGIVTRFAAQLGDPRVSRVAGCVGAPLRIGVSGRDGVGVSTVAAALVAEGYLVAGPEPGPLTAVDVVVRVVAEALKPEDRAVLAAHGQPTLTLLTKADLAGSGGLATAAQRAAAIEADTGIPAAPVVGLLAGVQLDDELVAALQTLAATGTDLTSVDVFASAGPPVPAAVRSRLLGTLDRFGIAHAVLALTKGAEIGAIPALLRSHSGFDRAVERLEEVAAPVRYQRACDAVAQLRALSAQSGDARVDAFLTDAQTVLALMDAATAVLRGAGLDVDRQDTAAAHLDRAVHWQRYGGGPVDALHRACAADLTRGSLRLLAQVRR